MVVNSFYKSSNNDTLISHSSSGVARDFLGDLEDKTEGENEEKLRKMEENNRKMRKMFLSWPPEVESLATPLHSKILACTQIS